jgi:Mg2+-importing ATPase
LKYVFVTISANFGNVVSMAGGTMLLPFLPLLPRQILTLNLLSDIPGMTIAEDNVDPEQVRAPTRWDIAFVKRFMVTFGLISSCFDFLTFAVLRWGFDARAPLFHTGWFLMSVGTELAVMLVLRTRRPFIRSRPAAALVTSTFAIAVVTVTIPFLPVASELGFRAPSASLLLTIAALIAGYIATTEVMKRIFYRFTPVRRSPPSDELTRGPVAETGHGASKR